MNALLLVNDAIPGTLVNNCELIYQSSAYTYKVTFGNFAAYKIERTNKFNDDTDTVLLNGTLDETIQVLTSFEPLI